MKDIMQKRQHVFDVLPYTVKILVTLRSSSLQILLRCVIMDIEKIRKSAGSEILARVGIGALALTGRDQTFGK